MSTKMLEHVFSQNHLETGYSEKETLIRDDLIYFVHMQIEEAKTLKLTTVRIYKVRILFADPSCS